MWRRKGRERTETERQPHATEEYIVTCEREWRERERERDEYAGSRGKWQRMNEATLLRMKRTEARNVSPKEFKVGRFKTGKVVGRGTGEE